MSRITRRIADHLSEPEFAAEPHVRVADRVRFEAKLPSTTLTAELQSPHVGEAVLNF